MGFLFRLFRSKTQKEEEEDVQYEKIHKISQL